MNWKALVFFSIFILIFLDSFFFNIPLGPLRMTLLRLTILIVFIFMLLQIYTRKDHLEVKRIKFPLVFLGIWFYYGVLSLIWASNKVATIKELYYLSVFIILILVLVYLLQNMKSSWISNSFWICGLVIIFISFIEFAFDVHLPTSRFVIEAERFTEITVRRSTTFFYNENDLALFLVLIFPFYLSSFLSNSGLLKVINMFILISIFIINYVNDARLGSIALLLQAILFIILYKRNLVVKSLRFLLLFSPIIILVGTFLTIEILQKETLFEGIRAGQGSGFIRMNLYLNSLYATFQSFMLGVGPGNFQYNIYPQFDTLGFVNPHNWWLEVLTNYGLFIFIGYCSFFVFILVGLFKIYRSRTRNSKLSLTLFLSFIGFSIACLGPSSLFYYWPMWLFYGVSLAVISKGKIIDD